MSVDILDFWAARIAEIEQAALACETPAPWTNLFPSLGGEEPEAIGAVRGADGSQVVYDEGSPSTAEARHIALHDPDQVLREVARDRAVMALHQPDTDTPSRYWDKGGACSTCGEAGCCATAWPCRTVLLHVAVWDWHDQYDPAWKVEP